VAIKASGPLVLNDLATKLAACAGGNGIAQTIELDVGPLLARGDLVQILPDPAEAALAEQQMSARLAGVGLQQAVHAETLAHLSQQCQQRGGESADQQQTVTTHGFADAGGGKPHPEPQILGVTELRFDIP
jgi:DNA-binding transcriptional LysR family regulator